MECGQLLWQKLSPLQSDFDHGWGREQVLPHLLVNEILSQPFKHIMVTAALAWRGMFIAKYWGIVGAASTVAYWIHTMRFRDWSFTVMLLPDGLYDGISRCGLSQYQPLQSFLVGPLRHIHGVAYR